MTTKIFHLFTVRSFIWDSIRGKQFKPKFFYTHGQVGSYKVRLCSYIRRRPGSNSLLVHCKPYFIVAILTQKFVPKVLPKDLGRMFASKRVPCVMADNVRQSEVLFSD